MATVRRETSQKSSLKTKASSPKPKASGFLDSVDDVTEETDVGLSMVIYGKEGVGKTSLAAHFPSPIFIIDKQEQGIRRLLDQKLVPSSVKVGRDIESWPQLLEAVRELAEADHQFETVVLDSMTGFQRLCFQECADREFHGDMSKEGFFAFSNGPKVAAQAYWPELLDALTDLQQQNIATVLLGHTVVKTFNNPEGPDYDRVVADVDKSLWAITSRWAGAVLYYRHNVDLSKEGRKIKASGGEQRLLCTEYDAAYDAKNSYGLPPVLDPYSSAKECFDDLWKRLHKSHEEKSAKKIRK